jgi:hypothetical protein
MATKQDSGVHSVHSPPRPEDIQSFFGWDFQKGKTDITKHDIGLNGLQRRVDLWANNFSKE